jgi:hypothetical protein
MRTIKMALTYIKISIFTNKVLYMTNLVSIDSSESKEWHKHAKIIEIGQFETSLVMALDARVI